MCSLCKKNDLFRLCPPQYVMRPPVTEHVPLHSKSLCINMARASGCAINMRPLSWGCTNRKDPKTLKGDFIYNGDKYINAGLSDIHIVYKSRRLLLVNYNALYKIALHKIEFSQSVIGGDSQNRFLFTPVLMKNLK